MIISDLNYLEVVSASSNVEGGISYNSVDSTFNTTNKFTTIVNSPYTWSNSASAGAIGEAINPYSGYVPSYSFTKADTSAVTFLFGGSRSTSTSAAVINPAPYH